MSTEDDDRRDRVRERRRSGAEHRDHGDPFREDTRPGPHVVDPLGETEDDPPPLTPVEGIAVSIINDAAAKLDRASTRAAIDIDMKAAEVTAVHGSEWARGVDADIAKLKEAVATPSRWRTLKLAGKWITGGAVMAALGLVIKVLIAHGAANEKGANDDATLRRLDRTMHRVIIAISRIAGRLGLDVDLDDNAPPKDFP